MHTEYKCILRYKLVYLTYTWLIKIVCTLKYCIHRQLGDDEAMALDETFIKALEYRLPIHRLAMLLSDS